MLVCCLEGGKKEKPASLDSMSAGSPDAAVAIFIPVRAMHHNTVLKDFLLK